MKKILMVCLFFMFIFCSAPLHTFYCETGKDIKEFATVQGVQVVKVDTISNWKTRTFLIYYRDTAKIK